MEMEMQDLKDEHEKTLIENEKQRKDEVKTM